ncbi:retrovirus-related pol polyprotein from transposon TNT 1-94 [Tanacetum coccineum]
MSQEKEAQKKFYKTREDKEIEKVIALENKVKVLDDIVYKTGQSVQTMNMLNRNYKTSFVKPEFFKKAQRENPCLYDIGCYNDNIALMLAPESDEMIHSFIQNTIEGNFSPQIRAILADLEKFHLCLKEEMVDDLRYFNSLEDEVNSLKYQLETQKTQFLNEIDRLSREYYYADHMNAILDVYTKLDEVTSLQSNYLEVLEKCQSFENELLKRNTMSKSFEALQQHAINFELALHQSQLHDRGIAISELKKLIEKMIGKYVETKFEKPSVIRQSNAFKNQRQSILGVIPTTSVSRPQFKSNQLEDRVMHNNSQGKKQQVEDHRRNFKFYNIKTSVTTCNDSLNAKTSHVNFVCVTYGKCVLNDNHDMCVLHYINGVNSRTKQPIVVPISTREPKRNVNQSVATPLKKIVATESTNQKPKSTTRKQYERLVEINLFIVDSGCSKHMRGNLKLLSNYVDIFLGTMKFENDEIAPILGYGDLVQGNGNDLLTGSRGTDLYSITLQDTSTPNPIFLMAKASSSQAWLWHHRLSHLNFGTINLLSKYDILTGLLKQKFIKDHLCYSCELGKAKRSLLTLHNIYITQIEQEKRKRACSFMLCDLDFEPLSLSLSSLPSCDLMSLTNMLILLHYLESFKSEFAENYVHGELDDGYQADHLSEPPDQLESNISYQSF